jgi:hypothetical protein
VATPAVVIELPAGDRGSPLASALVAACNESVADAHCALASDAPPPDIAAAAVVSWDEDRRIANVSVVLRRGTKAWLSRRIEFKDADAPRERFRAVGLVIATLVGEADRAAKQENATTPGGVPAVGAGAGEAGPAPAETKPASPGTAATPEARVPDRVAPPVPAERSLRERTHEWVWVEGGLSLDPAIGSDWLHGGGWLHVAARPSQLPAFIRVGASYAASVEDRGLGLSWLGGSIGVGAILPASDCVRFELHAEAVAQRVHAAIVESGTASGGAQDSGARWVGGAGVGASFVWSPAPPWALIGGFDADVFSSATAVRVRGETRGRDSAFSASILVGARLYFR